MEFSDDRTRVKPWHRWLVTGIWAVSVRPRTATRRKIDGRGQLELSFQQVRRCRG